jgi:hypothetical protein
MPALKPSAAPISATCTTRESKRQQLRARRQVQAERPQSQTCPTTSRRTLPTELIYARGRVLFPRFEHGAGERLLVGRSWDSLGEFLALAVSIEELAEKSGNTSATLLANALNDANGRYLDEDRSPSRNVGELDTRGSHFYIALYWAEAVASQTVDAALAARFAPIAKALATNEAKIVTELNAAQGVPVDIGGYYHPDDAMAFSALRPSPTLNAIIDAV